MSSPIDKNNPSSQVASGGRDSFSAQADQHLRAPPGQSDRLSTDYFDSSSYYSQEEYSIDNLTTPTSVQPRERALPQHPGSPHHNSPLASVTFNNTEGDSGPLLPQLTYSPPRATTTNSSTMHPLNEINNALSPKPNQPSPYISAPSLMPPPLTNESIVMTKSGDFGEVIIKLEAIAQMAEKILGLCREEGASLARHLKLPGEIEKLCKAMASVTADEVANLDGAVERKLVVSAKWAVVVKNITNLSFPLKTLPTAHPNRSKIIKGGMVRALEIMEEETEKVRAAVEVYVGEEPEVAGKKVGKGAHLVTLVSTLVDTWSTF